MRRRAWPDPAVSFAFLFGAIVCFSLSDAFLRHHDIGWHLAAGDLIRAQRALPRTDPWSFTAGDTRWYDLSWLWDIGLSLLYQAGGFAAPAGVTVLLGACVSGLLASLCRSAGCGRVASALGSMTALTAVIIYQPGLDFAFCVAPQAWSMLFFLLHWRLLEYHRAGRATFGRTCALSGLLMLCWVNIHGGFPLYFMLLAVYGAESYLTGGRAGLRPYAALALIGACCLCLNPYGPFVLAGAARSLLGVSRYSITEWRPFGFGDSLLASAYLLGFILLAPLRAAPACLRYRLLALLFLVMGLGQVRHYAYFLLGALPLLLLGLEQALRGQAVYCARLDALERDMDEKCRAPRAHMRSALAALGITVLLASPPALTWNAGGALHLPENTYPHREIAWLAEHFPGERVYNHWNFGGYLIFAARDSLKPIIDGRGDTAYPEDVVSEQIHYGREAGVIRKYGLRAALMPKYLPSTLVFFDTSSEWEKAFEGKVANVYVRR